MIPECLKTCSPSRDLLVVRSLFFFVRKNHEFQIHLDHLTSFFLCCCKCLLLFRFYIKTSSTSSSSHKTAVLHLSLLFKRTTVPPRVFIRPYIRNPIFRAGSLSHTHTHAQEREISRWPLASTACCACVYAEHVTSAYKNSWRRLD